MNSYISSFRASLAALAIIGLIELAYAAIDRSSPVERSSYLNWNFNSVEQFHKIVISEKLENAIRNRPSVIQVGDSSGFHAIVPDVVDQYLGGLRYENVSCCGNMGFDGYYSVVDFMLQHTSSIKAVVLYITLNNFPSDPGDVDTASVGGEDRLRSAYGPLSRVTSSSALAARSSVLRWMYSLGGTYDVPGSTTFADLWPALIQSMRANRGWRPEGDAHPLPEAQSPRLTGYCGPSNIRRMDRQSSKDYTRDIFGHRHSYAEVELRRLAALTARHGAKLVLIVQPYPCPSIEGTLVAALESDIDAVKAEYPNLIVPDPALFEAWPSQRFTSPDHIRVGYEDALSRRAGRLVAKALNIPFQEPPALLPFKPPASVFHASGPDFLSWDPQGLSRQVQVDGKSVVVEESRTFGAHLMETSLGTLPAGTYVATLVFQPEGDRPLLFGFRPTGRLGDSGQFYCMAGAGEVVRTMTVLDATIERLPEHLVKCSGIFRISKPGLAMRIGFEPAPYWGGKYQADGAGRTTLYSFDLSAVHDVH